MYSLFTGQEGAEDTHPQETQKTWPAPSSHLMNVVSMTCVATPTPTECNAVSNHWQAAPDTEMNP